MAAENMPEGRVLAIDLGRRRVGLAMSDPLGYFAVGLDTLTLDSRRDFPHMLLERLEALCQEYAVHTIILGLPRNMDGSEGPKAKESRDFAQVLTDRLGLPVVLLDERLTSVMAQNTLREQGIQPSRHKDLVDQAAAKRILQDYLDQQPR